MEQTHIKRQGSAGPGSNKLMGLNRQRGGGGAPSVRQTSSPAKKQPEKNKPVFQKNAAQTRGNIRPNRSEINSHKTVRQRKRPGFGQGYSSKRLPAISGIP